MRKRLAVLSGLLAVFVLVLTGCAVSVAQESGPVAQASDASQSLVTLRALVTEENYERMGFKSMDEVSLAAMGEPVQDFMVHLDTLQKYQEGGDAGKILSATGLYVYPVLVKGETRSSISGTVKDERFTAVSFGRPNYISMIADQLKKQSEKQKLPASSFFIVRIPALNYVFLGNYVNDKLMLTPVIDVPEYKLFEGETTSAESVFLRLVPAAREHNGLPG